MKVILTKEQLQLLYIGDIITTKRYAQEEDGAFEQWYHIPDWVKKCEDGTYEIYTQEELPQQIKDLIKGQEIKNNETKN